MSAADLIRQHLEALPEPLRVPWQQGELEYGTVVAQHGLGYVLFRLQPYSHEAVGLIALLASPHVAEALAELLEVIAQHDRSDDFHNSDVCFEAIATARDALEAAISREGRST